MPFERIQRNYLSLRTRIRRAVIRPDPYGLPGWVTNSDSLAETIRQQFGQEFAAMITGTINRQEEAGRFICYDFETDNLTLGPLCWGSRQAVLVQDCIGFRPVGSFHTHLTMFKGPAFSPPDIRNGLHEFALAVGGAKMSVKEWEKVMQNGEGLGVFKVAILSPWNYWLMNNRGRDQIDQMLNEAELLVLEANRIFLTQPINWREMVHRLNNEADAIMFEVFDALRMVNVTL